jgi:large subunit ribosomal protein L4
LNVAGKKLLIVIPEQNKNVYLSARNLKNAEVILASELNTYKVLNANALVMDEASLSVIEQIFKA